MRQTATLRITQATTKYGEHAPMAAACCNACRTCVSTNLMTATLAGITAVWAYIGGRRHSHGRRVDST